MPKCSDFEEEIGPGGGGDTECRDEGDEIGEQGRPMTALERRCTDLGRTCRIE
jgi:hypothetical protein